MFRNKTITVNDPCYNFVVISGTFVGEFTIP